MKYFAVNEDIEKMIGSIKRDIMLSMNGICAEEMNKRGCEYRQNFGVSIVRLKEIASKYSRDYELAYRLWLLPIRETKILATMLCEPQKMTAEKLKEWSAGITNQEMAEVVSMYLLSKAEHLTKEYIAWLNSDNYLMRLTAYHTLSRLAGNAGINNLISIADGISGKDLNQVSAYRAIESIVYQLQEVRNEDLTAAIDRLMTRITDCGGKYATAIVDGYRL